MPQTPIKKSNVCKVETNYSHGFRIREINHKDLSRIIDIRKASLVEEFELFGSNEDSFMSNFTRYRLFRLIHRCAGKLFFRVYVGEILDEIVGMTILSRDGQNWRISGVMIDPKYRRRGYGKRLVSKVCDQAKRRGAKKIFLGVLERNALARAFYYSLGFEDFGKKLYFYADWGDLMKRNLPQGYKVAKQRDPVLFRLFAWVFKQEIPEKFAIFGDGETIGTLELRVSSRRKVATVLVNLYRAYRGVGLEDVLLGMAFDRAHKQGTDRLLVEVDERNPGLEEVCSRLNLKLLCVVCGMSRNLSSSRLRES